MHNDGHGRRGGACCRNTQTRRHNDHCSTGSSAGSSSAHSRDQTRGRGDDGGTNNGACCSSTCHDNQTRRHSDHGGGDNGAGGSGARSRGQPNCRFDDDGARCCNQTRRNSDRCGTDNGADNGGAGGRSAHSRGQSRYPGACGDARSGSAGRSNQFRGRNEPRSRQHDHQRRPQHCGCDQAHRDGSDHFRLAELIRSRCKIQPHGRHQRLRHLPQWRRRARQAPKSHHHERALRDLSQEHRDVRWSPNEPRGNRGELRQLPQWQDRTREAGHAYPDE